MASTFQVAVHFTVLFSSVVFVSPKLALIFILKFTQLNQVYLKMFEMNNTFVCEYICVFERTACHR